MLPCLLLWISVAWCSRSAQVTGNAMDGRNRKVQGAFTHEQDHTGGPAPWRQGYTVYWPNVTRGFIVDATHHASPLQENHDASIQWFDGRFIAAFNGAANASEISRRQLNRVVSSVDGLTWGTPEPLYEDACADKGATCQQWQPSMAVVQQPKHSPALWAFWCQFQGATTHTATFNQSAWFMSVLETGSKQWKHKRFDSPTRDTYGRNWILFPTQNPVQLASGRVLVPISMMPNGPTSQKGGISSVLYTDDGGLTFQLSPGTPQASTVLATSAWEPDVWEQPRKDNSGNSTVHMILRAVSYGVRSDQVLQYTASDDEGCTWEPLQVLPIESVPNRPGIGKLPAEQESGRVLMLDSDWSPRSPLTSIGESCRFNLAMFCARPGDGPRFTAGFGFTGDEDFVMYPQWTAINNSLYVAYSQGMVQRSIKFARISPLPDPQKFYVFPRSEYVGNGGVRSNDGSDEHNLQLCGGSAGVDLDATARNAGDIVQLQFSFGIHQDGPASTTARSTIVTVGDALNPLRLQVTSDLRMLISSDNGAEIALNRSVERGQWIAVTVATGGSFTNISIGQNDSVANTTTIDDAKQTPSFAVIPHSPSNTWLYLGEGFSTARQGQDFFHAADVQSRPSATNYSLVSRLHPVDYTGPGCSRLPRPMNATVRDVVDSCFSFSAKLRGIDAFWVFYHPHPESDEHHTRCCPKSSFSTKDGWRPQNASDDQGAFYQLTDFVVPNATTRQQQCFDYDLVELRTRVMRVAEH
eukprot:COSAG06_NODE_1145_length_10532_cov_16.966261_2_plen_752_part_00